MSRLSRDDRKRMRKGAEERIRNLEFRCWVVSPKAKPEIVSAEALLDEAKKVGVNLVHRPVRQDAFAVGVPGGPDQFQVLLEYTTVDERLLAGIEDFEWLTETKEDVAMGLPAILFRGQYNLDPAIDFLGMAVKRVLGRLAGGILISAGNRVVLGDWLSWSLDYLDPDTFKITRLYDNPPPDFQHLADRFPQLRWRPKASRPLAAS